MNSYAVKRHRTIEATVERVWEVLTDLDGAPERFRAITDVQILTTGPYAVGTTWIETRRSFGRSASEEMCVTDNDPLRHTVLEASSAGATYRTVFRLGPQGGSHTELSLELTIAPSDPSRAQLVAWAVFGRVGLKATARALEQDLDDIAAAARAPASD